MELTIARKDEGPEGPVWINIESDEIVERLARWLSEYMGYEPGEMANEVFLSDARDLLEAISE